MDETTTPVDVPVTPKKAAIVLVTTAAVTAVGVYALSRLHFNKATEAPTTETVQN